MSEQTKELLLASVVFLFGTWDIRDSWKRQRVLARGGVSLSREKYPFFFWSLFLAEIAAVLFAGWVVLFWLFKRHLPV